MWNPKKGPFMYLWFAQSPVRPIVMSSFSKLSIIWNTTQEEKFDKWQLLATLALRRNMALPGRSASLPQPNHLTSFGFISQEPRADTLWGPRAITSHNLMNSFLISVLQPTPNTSSASRSTCKPRTVWRSLLLRWGPLLWAPYIIWIYHSTQLLLFKNMISPTMYLNPHNNELYYNRIFL